MRYPDRETMKVIRQTYTIGTKVLLIRMEDPQAPPIGTHGTVIGVDDAGTIHVHWDNGSSLGVAYSEDECRRIDND